MSNYLLELGSRWVVARACGKWRDGERAPAFSYKRVKFWGCTVVNYSLILYYSTVYFKLAKRDLKCSHCTCKKVTVR